MMEEGKNKILKVKFPPLEEYQKELLYIYDKHPKDLRVVVKSPRQVGKSIGLQLLLLYASLKEANSVSICVAPISNQSRKNFEELINFSKDLITKSNSTLMDVTFINGSQIKFRSAESGDNLRGLTVKKSGILVIDEAAYIQENFFYNVLLPMTNVFHGSIFLASTPKFKTGLFYSLFSEGELSKDSNVISCDWTKYDLSKYLSPTLLETYRKQMPEIAFKSEYLAEFIDSEGSVFSNFKNCSKEEIKTDINEPIVLSIDWGSGTGNDNTAITFSQCLNNKIYVSKVLTFNDLKAPDTIKVIISQIKKLISAGWKDITVIVEQNSIGNVFYDLLFDAIDELDKNYEGEINFGCQKFLTTNKSKDKLVKQLELCFEQEKIEMIYDEDLMLELTFYECTINSNGNPIYNAISGHHDDRVISLMIGVNKWYKEVVDE